MYIVDTEYPICFFMHIQLSTEFALHGLLYIGSHREKSPIQLAEIAAAIKVRESYLRKIFQQLVKADFLEAYKGSSGGYSLRSDPGRISFYDVFKAMEGTPATLRCYADQRDCAMHRSCPITEGFSLALEGFYDQLKRVTLQQVLEDVSMREARVAWMFPSASDQDLVVRSS